VARNVIFSLWSGPLPTISELHFRSTLHHMGPDSVYHLYLDTSPGYEGIVTEEFAWLEQDPRVQITRISVIDYLRSHGISLPDNPHHVLPTAFVRRWLRLWFLLVLLVQKLINRVFPENSSLSLLPHGVHDDPAFGITAGHGFSPWRQEEDLSYRADIFRALAPEFFPDANVLWLDLDIAVLEDLSWLEDREPLVYRWGTYPFGNNAVIYLPADRLDARQGLVDAMNKLGAARPWTLFSDTVCKDINMTILPVDEFDPPFTEGHELYEDYAGLLAPSASSPALAESLRSSLKMLHWHNSWRVVPPSDSAFGHILGYYRSVAGSSTSG